MKKTSKVIKEKNTYEIDILINNTAFIKSVTGKSGLLNIKTNQVIGDMDYYYTIYDPNGQFYCQEKNSNNGNDKTNNCKIVRIYDALNEKMIVDGYEVIGRFSDNYHLTAFRSLKDGKIHLFDKYTCRKSSNIFDMPLDSVEFLFSEYNDIYLVVSVNGKKGLYHHNCYDKLPSLETSIEYDNIERFSNIIVFTMGDKKHFEYTGYNRKVSSNFDDIIVDSENKNIIYCKKGNLIYVYDTTQCELLLVSNCDEVKFMFNKKSEYGSDCNYFFKTMNNGKYGVMNSITNNETRKVNGEAKTVELLNPVYDDVSEYHGTILLKKNDKYGLFYGDSRVNQVVEPNYDSIDYLGYNYFAFYKNGKCDIGKALPYCPFKPYITDCEIVEEFEKSLIYKKNNKYGILFADSRNKEVVDAVYDSIKNVAGYYYIVEKNNKKGLMHLGKEIIPPMYDEINLCGSYGIYGNIKDANVLYCSLKNDNCFRLSKMSNWKYVETDASYVNNHVYSDILFLRDIMVLKDNNNTYIYDYNENLLRTLPKDTIVTAYEKPCESSYRKENGYLEYFYFIDGVYYYYKNGKFEEVFTENNDLYITTYETDTDTYEIKSYNEFELDSFCSFIDSKDESEAQKVLDEICSSTNNSYKALVLSKTTKKQ